MLSFSDGTNFTPNRVKPTKINILPPNFFGNIFKPNMSYLGNREGFAHAIIEKPFVPYTKPERKGRKP